MQEEISNETRKVVLALLASMTHAEPFDESVQNRTEWFQIIDTSKNIIYYR